MVTVSRELIDILAITKLQSWNTDLGLLGVRDGGV